MSSSARAGRFIRGARHETEDVFVLGQSVPHIPSDGVLATATAVIAAGQRQGEEIIDGSRIEAARIIAEAEASAEALRSAARDDGYRD